jgi:ethanolamine utilization microcompartment shell protein EutS
MATELKSHADQVTLTRFFGGSDRGTCVQVTVNQGAGQFEHVALTRAQAAALAADLLDFAQGREVEDV